MRTVIFLYHQILKIKLGKGAITLNRPQKGKRVPVVISKDEARAVINQMKGQYRLIAQILYGSGLRLMECLCLRVKDIDFENHRIIVYDGKGGDDRVTMLPESAIAPLRQHLDQVKVQHQNDLTLGFGSVDMPFALGEKYPTAHKPGAAWAERCKSNNDLYPCPQTRIKGSAQPAGLIERVSKIG